MTRSSILEIIAAQKQLAAVCVAMTAVKSWQMR
jgi:hypothetical protein